MQTTTENTFLFCILVWSIVLLQLYFAFYYSSSLICIFLGVVIVLFVIIWSKYVFQHKIKPANKILFSSLFTVLILSHLKIITTHFIWVFKPKKYIYQHGIFFVCLLIILLASFWKWEDSSMILKWSSLIAFVITFLLWQSSHTQLAMISFCFGVILVYSQPVKLNASTASACLALSVIVGFLQMVCSFIKRQQELKSHLRPLVLNDQIQKHLEHLRFINLVEELYLWKTKSSKLGKRPFLNTPKELVAKIKKYNPIFYPDEQTLVGLIMKKSSSKIIVAIRGTNNPWEWTGNVAGASHMYSKTDNALKHTEMNKASKIITAQILDTVKEDNITQICLTGHSRGSTLALYTYLQLKRIYPKIQFSLILYAPPPFFDETLNIEKVSIEILWHEKDIMKLLHLLTPIGVGYFKNQPIYIFDKMDPRKPKQYHTLTKQGQTKPFVPSRLYNYHDLIWYILDLETNLN